MPKRLFSPEELVDLAMSGQARMRRAVDTGDAKQVRKTLNHVLGLYRQFIDLYHGWTASLFVHLNAQYGHEATKGMTPIEYTLARSAEAGMNLQAVQRFVLDPESAMDEKLKAKDFNGAYECFLEMERGARDLHDFYRDYVSFIMSNLYRTYGVEAQELALRASSEKDWMPWMQQEIDSAIKERVVVWAELLGVANFGSITIEEFDDRVEMIQNPCGSCGRQHRGGRYDSPWNLATVEEKHPITYGTGGAVIYRTHIPQMHYLMPVEKIGAPWPLLQCPRKKTGHCKLTMFKDARQPVPKKAARWSD